MTSQQQEVSGAAKGVLIVSGASAILLVVAVGFLLARCVRSVLNLFPKKSTTTTKSSKKKSKGQTQPGPSTKQGNGVSAQASAPSDVKERGPDLKSLIKEQQKAASKKMSVKDDQASHHSLFLNTLKGHGDVVHQVCWNAEGTQLLTSCEDMLVRQWELQDVTAKEPKFKRIKPARSPLGAAFGDALDSVVVYMRGTPDAQVACYVPPANKGEFGVTGYEQQWLVGNVHGKESPLCMASAAADASISKRGVVVTLSQRKEARVYNTQGRELAVIEPNSLTNHNLAVSRDGRFVAVASFTAEVKIWEIKYDKITGEFKGVFKAMELKGHKSQVMAVAFSPDSKRCVTASKDGTLRVWNIDVRYQLEEDPKTLLVISQPLATGRLYQHLAYGPGGLIAASWEGMVHILRATDGEMLDSIDAHDASITSMQWCPRLVRTPGTAAPHAILATSSRDRRVRLWKAPEP